MPLFLLNPSHDDLATTIIHHHTVVSSHLLDRPNKFTTNSPKPRDQNGSAVVLLLSILPLFIALYFLVMKDWGAQKLIQNQRLACESVLIETQKSVGNDIRALLALNLWMKAAKIEHKLAQAALAAAIVAANPPAIAAAQVALKATELQLKLLRARQLYLIQSANWHMFKGLKSAKDKIEQETQLERKQSLLLQGFALQWGLPSITMLAVRTVEVSDPYPTYELKDGFTDKQTLSLTWKVIASRKTNKFQKGAEQWTYQNSCGVSLKSEDKKTHFAPVLAKAKWLWKQSWFSL